LGVKIFKFFEADPGRNKLGSGINLLDPQHCQLRYRIIFDLKFNVREKYLDTVEVAFHLRYSTTGSHGL
jgi:hypothetical protein